MSGEANTNPAAVGLVAVSSPLARPEPPQAPGLILFLAAVAPALTEREGWRS